MDVDAEREKIRREIEELERSLGADVSNIEVPDCSLESPSEDEDGSEDDDYDVDPSTQVRIDVGPDGGEPWEEESEGEADINLPETPETCLQMNLVYQEVIQEKIEEISVLIAQNKEEQEKLTRELAGSKGPKSDEGRVLPANMFLGHFMKPYFKDKTSGLGPPANSDTREKASQGIKSFEELVTVKWKSPEKELVRQSVVSDRLHRLLQPKLLKLDYLNEKLGKCKDEMGRQILEKQIQETAREINDINLLPEERLLGERLDEHDWDKIANVNFEGARSAKELRKYWQNYEHPHINKEQWSEDEVALLKDVAERHSCQNWEAIAQELGTQRTAFQCLQVFQAHNKDFKKSEWTPEEDQVLSRFVQEMRVGQHIPYRKIAYYMEGRDSAQLIYRWTKRLDPSLKRGAWTPEEDALLLKAVAKYGARDWYKIRAEVPGRSDNQCRDRYVHALHDDIKKGKWSEEEERKLIDLTEKYGMGRWAKIASELPHRSGSQCLSKWKVLLGYRKKAKRGALHPKRKRSASTSSCEDSDLEVEWAENGPEEKRPRRRKPRAPYCYRIPRIDLWVPTRKAAPEAKPERPGSVAPFRDESRTSGHKAAADEQRRRAAEDLFALNSGTPQAARPVPGEEAEEGGKNLGRTKDSWKVSLAYVKRVLRRNGYELQRRNRESLRKKRFASASQAGPAGSRLPDSSGRAELRRRKDRLWNATLTRRLMLAVTPWAGSRVQDLALRVKEKEAQKSTAEFIFQQLQSAHLPSTPIFTLFIQLLHIDAEGCMKVIHKRKSRQPALLGAAAGKLGGAAQTSSAEDAKALSGLQGILPHPSRKLAPLKEKAGPVPANAWRTRSPPRPTPKPKTVSELLREKRLREARAKREAQKRLVLPSHLLLPPSVIIQPPAVPLSRLLSGSEAATPAATPLPPALSSEGDTGPLQKTTEASRDVNGPESSSKRSVLGKSSSSSRQGRAVAASETAGRPPTQVPAPALLQIPAVEPPNPPASQNAAGLTGTPGPSPAAQEPPRTQQHPVNAVPPATAFGPSWVPEQILPITWVLTPQGLIPVLSLPAQGNLPGGSCGLPPLPSPGSSLLKAPAVSLAPVVDGANRPQTGTQPQGAVSGGPSSAEGSRPKSVTGPAVLLPPANSGGSQHCLSSPHTPSPSSPGSSSESAPTGNPPSALPTAAHPNHPSESAPQVPASGRAEDPSGPQARPPRAVPTPPPSQKERVAPDYSLISLEDAAAVKGWLKAPPEAEPQALSSGHLPYLPPFLCSLKTLSALLLRKEALARSAAALVPHQGPAEAAGQPDVDVLRTVVRKKLQDNPAYRLLRGRFLAAFTFPAALAALPPPRVKTTVLDGAQWERGHEEDLSSLSEEDGEAEDGSWNAGGAGEGQEEPGAGRADSDGVREAGIRRSTRLAGRGSRTCFAESTSEGLRPSDTLH